MRSPRTSPPTRGRSRVTHLAPFRGLRLLARPPGMPRAGRAPAHRLPGAGDPRLVGGRLLDFTSVALAPRASRPISLTRPGSALASLRAAHCLRRVRAAGDVAAPPREPARHFSKASVTSCAGRRARGSAGRAAPGKRRIEVERMTGDAVPRVGDGLHLRAPVVRLVTVRAPEGQPLVAPTSPRMFRQLFHPSESVWRWSRVEPDRLVSFSSAV